MKENKLTIRELVLYAIFGALIFALKFAMSSLPNIEPVTLLIILSAICFKKRGAYVLISYIALEILVYGIGIWTIGYLYIWLILYILSRTLLTNNTSSFLAAILGAIFGLCFGAFYIPIYFILGNGGTAITWWIAGIPYDLVHCISNFIIILLCYSPLKKVLLELTTRAYS